MRWQNPRSAKISLFFLIPAGVALYHWYNWRQFSYLYLPQFRPPGIVKMIGIALCVFAGAYFLWHAIGGRPARSDAELYFRAVGVLSSILAIMFTIAGLGYERHAMKIAVLTILYIGAAFSFWRSHKGYPLSIDSERN